MEDTGYRQRRKYMPPRPPYEGALNNGLATFRRPAGPTGSLSLIQTRLVAEDYHLYGILAHQEDVGKPELVVSLRGYLVEFLVGEVRGFDMAADRLGAYEYIELALSEVLELVEV